MDVGDNCFLIYPSGDEDMQHDIVGVVIRNDKVCVVGVEEVC